MAASVVFGTLIVLMVLTETLMSLQALRAWLQAALDIAFANVVAVTVDRSTPATETMVVTVN